MENTHIHQIVEQLCQGKGTLLYLIKFGSHLYGTNTQSSDTDYKGIFLPHVENLILEKQCRSIIHHTGSDAIKNLSHDVDINLWSLQRWFELLKDGDTKAIDMLFSYTNKDVIIYMSPKIKTIFKSPMDYVNLRDNTAYVSYANQQAKKYGLRGTRLHLLKSIYEYVYKLLKSHQISEKAHFKVLMAGIKEHFFDDKLCFDKLDNHGANILYISGCGFHEKITILEAMTRLKSTYEKYGVRAILAEKNEDVDWKAISHAMRCILQVKELFKTNHLTFPLNDANYLKQVKAGKFLWKDCEKNIVEGLAELNTLRHQVPQNERINEIHEKMILSCYSQLPM